MNKSEKSLNYTEQSQKKNKKKTKKKDLVFQKVDIDFSFFHY